MKKPKLIEEKLTIAGMVSPQEYDWVRQFLDVAEKNPLGGFIELDLGKVMGLAKAYYLLLKKTKGLK